MTDSLKRELAIGVVLRPHGVRGHLKVRSLSGQAAHFLGLRDVRLRCGGQPARHAAVEEVSAGGGSIRIKVAGVDSPEAARSLVGCEIWVDRERAVPLAPGEYYLADLYGCRVLGPGGPVGTVAAIINAGAGDILEVRRDDGKSFLVPFRRQFVGDVDVEQATISLMEDPTDT